MNKGKILFLLIISAVAIALITVVFWYDNYQEKFRSLSLYAPESALAYVEINLADNDLNNYLDQHQEAKDYLEKFILENEMAANIWRGDAVIDRLGLVILPGESGQLEKAWLIHGSDDLRKLEATELVDYFYTVLDDQIAVLTKSKKAFQEINSFKPVKGMGRLDFKKDDSFINGFVRDDLWASSWEEMVSSILPDKQWGLEQDKDIIWQLAVVAGEIEFSFELPLKLELKNNLSQPENRMVFLDNTLSIRQIELNTIVDILKESLDNETNIDWSLFEQYVDEKYNVHLNELYTFFERPVSVILKPKRLLLSFNELFIFENYDWVIISQSEPGEKLNMALNNFESLIQNYLAFKYPQMKTKVLPDGSAGKELVADTEKFNWQDKSDDNFLKKSISYQGGELAYGLMKDRFIFGSSLGLIELVIKAGQEEENNTSTYEVRFDTGIIDNDFLNLGKILWLASEIKSDGVMIHGRLENGSN